MIKAALARWHTTTAACRERAVRELSRWSRGSLLALLGFGSFLLFMGGLLTFLLIRSAYELLQQAGLTVPYAHYELIVEVWLLVLVLIFGGDSVRAAGWGELRRRANPMTDAAIGASGSQWSAVLRVLFASVMLLWGVMGLEQILRWLFVHFVGRPLWTWPSTVRSLDVAYLSSLTAWWLLTLVWLAGGGWLLWNGIRSLKSQQRTEGMPQSAGATH